MTRKELKEDEIRRRGKKEEKQWKRTERNRGNKTKERKEENKRKRTERNRGNRKEAK
jgi:hypothetical protein